MIMDISKITIAELIDLKEDLTEKGYTIVELAGARLEVRK